MDLEAGERWLCCAFVSNEVDMNRSDESSSQRFPSSYHHIDQSSSGQNSLNHLLSVLICHVNVINLQQPIVHPGNTEEEVNDETLDKLLVKRKMGAGFCGELVP